MLSIYILTGLISLLALALVFAPHGAMGGQTRTLVEEEEPVIVLDPEDLEDTQTFIRLPFYALKPIDVSDHFVDEDEATQRFISSFPPPLREIDQPVWH